MRIKRGFTKRNIAGSDIVVPVGEESLRFNGMITLNETGGFFWDCFQEDRTVDEVVELVLKEYEVEPEIAKRDVLAFVKMLEDNDLLA